MNKIICHYNEYPENASVSAYPSNASKEVDKSKAIKDMSHNDLRMLIERLHSEREAESIIRDLKYNSGERTFELGDFKIDVSTPVNELYHYGIFGQKWGKRRFQNADGTRTSAGKIREKQNDSESKVKSSDDYKQSKDDKTKAPTGLSNVELKRLNDRMQLEKTYRELSAAEKKKGESFAKTILKDIAKGALTESGKKLLGNILDTVVAEPLSKSIKEHMKDKK